MRLQSSIVIEKKPEEVWALLGPIENIAKWDRGVARAAAVKQSADGGIGTEFSTYGDGRGPHAGQMDYRIVEAQEDRCKIQLTSSGGNARFFKTAYWLFQTEPDPRGTLLHCITEFKLNLRWAFLAPILYWKRSALDVDLGYLKRFIEDGTTSR